MLDTSIEYVKGVGPARAAVLRSELGIQTAGDLLFHLPFRYVDKRTFHRVEEIASEAAHVQVRGILVRVDEVGAPRKKRLTAMLEDDSGQLQLIWFKGASWVKPQLRVGQEYIVFGRPSFFKGKPSIAHPEFELASARAGGMPQALQPVYPSTEKLTAKGLHSNGLNKIIQPLAEQLKGHLPEFLPEQWRERFQFPSREDALRTMHIPADLPGLERARNRLKFEELLLSQLLLVANRNAQTREIQGVVFDNVGARFNAFYENRPFDLTGAQKRVLREIRADMRHGQHMNRLLQGDVGSGKTVVALLAALLAIDNGFQVCLMAPTEILANQHHETFRAMLAGLEVEVALLTGSVKASDRKPIHAALEDGSLHILIGTHALIEPVVKFQRLGLAIIDEQHRFGVKQRARLWKKSAIPPHVLVMTATPIPRTLSMTMYGDLDVSVIDELPPGRKPVRTVHRTDADRLRVFQFMEDEIRKGRQIYVVYPLIEESETLDYKDLMDGYEAIARRFPLPEYRLGIVHGRMKPEAKDYEMEQFASGHHQILVSTTVIEVGVNVPNASVMIIESAEKFGLSQLHQLRGRVGRGAEQSFCILMTGKSKLSDNARIRLETMCRTNDGFEIAEVDLQLRGPGDIMGTQQSGELGFRLADLTRDKEWLKSARHVAESLLEDDPKLEKSEHAALRKELVAQMKDKLHWGRIS